MPKKGNELHHATIHFTGHEKASVNVQYANPAPGMPAGADIDIEVKKGSALAKTIRTLGSALAAATSKHIGKTVSLHPGKTAKGR